MTFCRISQHEKYIYFVLGHIVDDCERENFDLIFHQNLRICYTFEITFLFS